MNQIVILTEKTLRIAGTQEEPLICAKDACEALGIANSRDALNRVPNDEKGVVTTDTLGGPQEMVFVNEPGLYRLVFLSRKSEAEAFKNKVFREVLPAIRKTGAYRTPRADLPPEILALPAGQKNEVIERLEICEELREARRLLQSAKEIALRMQSRRGFSWGTLVRRFYLWQHAGYNPLVLRDGRHRSR